MKVSPTVTTSKLPSPNISINWDLKPLTDVFFMRNLNITFIHHRILQCSVDFGVSKELLNLLNGHAFVNCHRCKCSAELVRMGFLDI